MAECRYKRQRRLGEDTVLLLMRNVGVGMLPILTDVINEDLKYVTHGAVTVIHLRSVGVCVGVSLKAVAQQGGRSLRCSKKNKKTCNFTVQIAPSITVLEP